MEITKKMYIISRKNFRAQCSVQKNEIFTIIQKHQNLKIVQNIELKQNASMLLQLKNRVQWVIKTWRSFKRYFKTPVEEDCAVFSKFK